MRTDFGRKRAQPSSLSSYINRYVNNLDDIDTSLMSSYETYLKNRGLCPNTTSFYMRNLRAVYNQAVRQGLIPQNHRFDAHLSEVVREHPCRLCQPKGAQCHSIKEGGKTMMSGKVFFSW